jgi:hypothetical protein
MKKLLFALSLTAVLVACKKDKKNEFTATDVTGTAVVKGNVSKNIITPTGSGGFTSSTRIPAQGVNVSVKVNKSDLYPNSNAQGADVYNATTDANGDYSISVKTNANGVQAAITIDGFSATLDTLVNGTVKPGLYSTYTSGNYNTTLMMGRNHQVNHSFIANNVSSNPNNLNIGTAVVTGSVGVQVVREYSVTGSPLNYSLQTIPVPAGHVVYLKLNNDPTLQASKVYTATTSANGYYSFTVETVAQGTSGFNNQNANIWIDDFATTRDTLKIGGTTKAGDAGVYSSSNTNQNNVYNNSIKNAVHLSYTNFTTN